MERMVTDTLRSLTSASMRLRELSSENGTDPVPEHIATLINETEMVLWDCVSSWHKIIWDRS